MQSFRLNQIKEEGRTVFYKKFYEALNSSLIKYYGLNEAEKILKLMEKGILRINNMESFFCTGKNSPDISHNLSILRNISLESYLLKILLETKLEEERNSNIFLSYFLIYLSNHYNKELKTEKGKCKFREFCKNFLYSCIEPSGENKVNIRVYEALKREELIKEIPELKGAASLYKSLLKIFFEEYAKIYKIIPKNYSIPRIEIIYFISEYTRRHQENYLRSTFMSSGTYMSSIKGILDTVSDLGEDTPELRAALNMIVKKSDKASVNDFNIDSIVKELKYIKENCNAKSFISSRNPEYEDFWRRILGTRTFPEAHNVKLKFCYITEVFKLFKSTFAEVVVDCSSTENYSDIKILVNLAAELALIKQREIYHEEPLPLNIILENIPYNNLSIIEEIRKSENKLLSKYNIKFHIIPFVKYESAMTRYGYSEPTYFRIISDIHTDVNKHMGYSFNFGEDFVLCCGDISGDRETSVTWLNSNVVRGALVMGNHIGYTHVLPELNKEEGLKEKYGMQIHPRNTRNNQIREICIKNTSENISPLNNKGMEIAGVKIFGITLYTDFKLFGEDKAEACEMLCQHQINDFKYITIFRAREVTPNKYNKYMEDSDYLDKPYITKYSPEHCKFYFNRGINHFEYFCKSKCGNGEPVVLMTHFGVSIYSIAGRYKSDPVSAYFASDLTGKFKELLDKGINLRMVCHGHVHDKCEYILKYRDKEILVIADPFGYYHEREDNQQDQSNYGRRIKIKDIKEGELWSKIYPEIPVYFI